MFKCVVLYHGCYNLHIYLTFTYVQCIRTCEQNDLQPYKLKCVKKIKTCVVTLRRDRRHLCDRAHIQNNLFLNCYDQTTSCVCVCVEQLIETCAKEV